MPKYEVEVPTEIEHRWAILERRETQNKLSPMIIGGEGRDMRNFANAILDAVGRTHRLKWSFPAYNNGFIEYVCDSCDITLSRESAHGDTWTQTLGLFLADHFPYNPEDLFPHDREI